MIAFKKVGQIGFGSAVALLGIAAGTPAMAGIIFNNGAPDLSNGWASDFSFPSQQADDFSLAPGAETIRDVHWWGLYAFSNTPTAPDNFTIRIFADNGGVPAVNSLFNFNLGDVGRMDTGDNIFVFDVYKYSVDIPDTTLVPNTPYWLSIVNNTAADTDDIWFWATSSQTGNAAERVSDGQNWVSPSGGPPGHELAFNLTTVPEPSAVLGLGLLGLGALVKRQLMPKQDSDKA